jgi:hypothetical protein
MPDGVGRARLAGGHRQVPASGTLSGPAGPFRHANAHLPNLEAFVEDRAI